MSNSYILLAHYHNVIKKHPMNPDAKLIVLKEFVIFLCYIFVTYLINPIKQYLYTVRTLYRCALISVFQLYYLYLILKPLLHL